MPHPFTEHPFHPYTLSTMPLFTFNPSPPTIPSSLLQYALRNSSSPLPPQSATDQPTSATYRTRSDTLMSMISTLTAPIALHKSKLSEIFSKKQPKSDKTRQPLLAFPH